MDALMLIVILIVVIICIIFGIYITLYNNLQDFVIRINEVESKIDNYLRNKYDNINRCVSIIKGNNKVNDELENSMFDEIVKIRNRKISNFDLYRKLVVAYNDILSIKDKYKEIDSNEEINKLIDKCTGIDNELEVSIDYYNRNISEYNKMIKLFPTNLVASVCKYKEKLFFDRKDMSDDDVNDFKL